jgi:hypothetical protein
MKLIFKTTEIPAIPTTDILPAQNLPAHKSGWCRLQKDDYTVAADETDIIVVDADKAVLCLNILLENFFVDYQLYRKCLKQIGNLSDTAWANLTTSTKTTVASNKCTTTSRIYDAIGNSYTMIDSLSIFDQLAREARSKRFETIKTMILQNIDAVQGLQIRNDLLNYCVTGSTNSTQREDFVVDGFEGVLKGEDLFESIIDYANATTLAEATAITGSGTDPFGATYGKYETIGLRAKTLTINTGSKYANQTELIDDVIDYILYGFNRTLILEQ